MPRPRTGSERFRCPVCRKPLTRREFEKATGVWESKKEHIQHLEQETRRLQAAKSSLERQKSRLVQRAKRLRPTIERQVRAEMRPVLKEKTKAAAEAAKQAEKKRSERLMAGQREKVGRLEQRLRQMEKGTTPQTEGLEYEGRLVHALQREFPSDEIKHAGKNGDVLHTIRFERKQIGLIVYECKRVPKVKTPHIEQTRRAKNSREADFGVLVTTGKKKGFDGIGSESGVLIVTPQGVIPLVSLLRSNLVELDKAKVIKGQRALVANRLVEHITSPQFKNPIQDVIQRTRDLEDTIKQEAREHVRTWEKRWSHYQAISWESALLQRNMELILRGKQPEPLRPPKPAPLALPESTK